MKNQSFWRGFGVGILFASLILGISCMIRTSDSQVVSRAKKLGMVYGNQEEMVTAKLDNEGKAEADPEASGEASASKEAESEKKTKEPAKKDEPKQTESIAAPTPEVDDVKKDSSAKEDSSEKKSSKKDNSGKDTSLEDEKKNMEDEKKSMQETIQKQPKTLEIKVGDWSSTVSSKLESMGIIKSATDFDKYLNDNGYSNSISAGTYKVSPGDSYRDLAKKITRR